MVGCGAVAAQERPAAQVICGGDVMASGTVARVVDGRTLALAEGGEVRLAAIEVAASQPDAEGAAAIGVPTSETLTALTAGMRVELRRAEYATDRYGDIVAYAYARRDTSERLVQADLIAAGLARVGDRVGGRNCAMELWRLENAARLARLGLWANPYYAVLHADNPAAVLAQRGRFALVEGKVVSVHESGATIYVNFGRRWSEEFVVTILKRNERKFGTAGLDLKKVAGQRVRVRGWIEERGAAGGAGIPWIEAERPEQIELADPD